MEIKKDTTINAGVSAIYKALTTEGGISGWWAKNATVPEMEGEVVKVVFHPGGMPFDMHFRINELIVNKKVLWSSVHNSNPSWLTTKISFDISGNDKQGIVAFRHYDFPADYDPKMEGATWDGFMQSLKSYCETGTGKPWD